MITEEVLQTPNSYLTFQLNNERFAIHVSKLLNIIELIPVTQVPKSPDFIKGVINLRGSILAVIELKMKLNLEASNYTKESCIVVLQVLVEGEPTDVGVIVDSVHDVIEIDEKEIQPPLNVGVKFKSEFVKGVFKFKDRFIMILDIDKIFSDKLLESVP